MPGRPAVVIACFFLEDQRQVEFVPLHGLGDRVPVAHREREELVHLAEVLEARRLVWVGAAQQDGQVLARRNHFRPDQQRREEAVHLLDVERVLAAPGERRMPADGPARRR